MKAILLSIKPKWVAKILNGEKTIEVRKKFPKDYVGWVYLYCSKSGDDLHRNCADIWWLEDKDFKRKRKKLGEVAAEIFNGKVVARFWCDNVREIKFDDKKVQRQACLTEDELFDYLFINEPYHEDMHKGYGINITELEIFDRPKELSEFHTVDKYGIPQYQFGNGTCDYRTVRKAPQNYCYVEGE